MTIYRVKKRDNYVVLDKGFLNDTELTWQAKGLLAYMLSLPNDWEFNMKDLQKRSKNGRDATYRIMKELIEAGYVTRVEKRDGGKFDKVEYIVHEVKQSPHTENPDTNPPYPENPDTGKPYTGNPYPENPTLLNNNRELNNKELNNKLTNYDDDNKGQPKENVPNAFRFFEENFYPFPSSVDIETINYWLDRFPEEIVICAMKKALRQNARNIAYVDKILMNWEMQKVKTLEDVERLDRQHELEKQRKRNYYFEGGYRKPVRTEAIPEWLKNINYETTQDDKEEDQDIEKKRQELAERLKKYKDEYKDESVYA